MFGILKQKAEKLRSISQKDILSEILNDDSLKAQIIDLNQHQLYDLGVQSDGTPTGDYAPITISKWKPLAASEGRDGRSDHITGKDTGITYDSMNVQVSGDGFVINADDRNNFFDREPKGLGLTGESISEILPEIKIRFKEILLEKIA